MWQQEMVDLKKQETEVESTSLGFQSVETDSLFMQSQKMYFSSLRKGKM